MLDFVGQVAVVTGAGSGIGKAITLGLAARGADICLVGRRREILEATVQGMSGHGKCYPADVTSDEAVDWLSAAVLRDFGRLDILVHSAAAFATGPMESASIDDLDRQYRTNVRAPYRLTQVMLAMLKASRGQVVFINSGVGLSNATANGGQYAVTKHALRAVADSLRAEVNALGVRVLSVYPGRTATPMQQMVHKLEGKIFKPERLLQPSDVADAIIHALALPRTAEVTDVSIRPMLNG
jgi:NAD(P)-dependent dehydrogenase (short-subunit alcohol dehydrogenase family)